MFREHYIRFFVSSTFADMETERNLLTEIFQKIGAEYERDKGWQIEYVDLRWGISEQDSLDNRTMTICKNELHRCQSLSPRPNFIFLLGERYGWIPLPEEVPNVTGRSLKLFDEFTTNYRRDFNNQNYMKSHSPIAFWKKEQLSVDEGPWVLLPFTGNAKNLKWREENIEKPLQDLFESIYKGLTFITGSNRYAASIRSSATEQEIWEGALSVEDASLHVVGYMRRLSDIPADKTDDFKPERNQAEMNRFRNLVKEKLPSASILEVNTSYKDYTSKAYEDFFKKEMERRIRKVIDDEIERTRKNEATLLDTEIERNDTYRRSMASPFEGRKDELEQIRRFIFDDDSKGMLWIDAPDGTGKSALLAKAYNMVVERNNNKGDNEVHCNPYYIRCGLTELTDSTTGVLNVLSEHIAKAYKNISRFYRTCDLHNKKDAFHRHNIASLLNDIKKNSDIPCVIFIDGVQNLSPETRVYFESLEWLKNVQDGNEVSLENAKAKIIVASDRPLPKARLFKGLEQMTLGRLNAEDSLAAIMSHLRSEKRTITDEQKGVVTKAIGSGKDPLYLKLLANYLLTAHSWTVLEAPPATTPQLTIALLNDIIRRQHHDPLMVWLTLTMIAMAQGIADAELTDILSADEHLKRNFLNNAKHEYKGQKSLPPIYWHRLAYDVRSIVQHGYVVYGAVNAISRKAMKDIVLQYAKEAKLTTGEYLYDYAAQALFKYYIGKWEEGNRHALYNLPAYALMIKEPIELYDLLNDMKYVGLLAEHFGEQLDRAFLMMLSHIDEDGELYLCQCGAGTLERVSAMRNWIVQKKGQTCNQIALQAYNAPDGSAPAMAMNRPGSVVWMNGLRNNLRDDFTVFRSALANHTPLGISDDSNHVLYINHGRDGLTLFDRTTWKYTSYTSKDRTIKLTAYDAALQTVAVSNDDNSVVVLRTDGWKVHASFNVHSAVHALALSADGRLLAITYDHALYLYDLEKRQPQPVGSYRTAAKSVCFSVHEPVLWLALEDELVMYNHAEGFQINISYFGELEKDREKIRIMGGTSKRCFLSTHVKAYQLELKDDGHLQANCYPFVKNPITGEGAYAVMYDKEGNATCASNNYICMFNGQNLRSSANVPSMSMLTTNLKYGMTFEGDIIDIQKASQGSYQIISCNTNTIGYVQMGINALSSDCAGNWMVVSAGVRHDEACTQILSVVRQEDGIRHQIASPDYGDDLWVVTGATAVAPDGTICAAAAYLEGTIDLLLFDREMKNVAHTVRDFIQKAEDGSTPGSESIRALQWSEDSRFLIGATWHHIANATGTMMVFDRQGTLLRLGVLSDYAIADADIKITLNKTGRYALSHADYDNVIVFDLEKGRELARLPLQDGAYEALALWHPCASIIYSCSEDRLKAYDINDKSLTPRVIYNGIKQLYAISPSGRYIYAAASMQQTLLRIDLSTGKATDLAISVKQVVCTYGDRYIAVNTPTDDILLIDTDSNTVVKKAYGNVIRRWMVNTGHALMVALTNANPLMLEYDDTLGVNREAFATVTRHWNFNTNSPDAPAVVCPHCAAKFAPPQQALAAIHSSAPVKGTCPSCGGTLIYNPFMAQ